MAPLYVQPTPGGPLMYIPTLQDLRVLLIAEVNRDRRAAAAPPLGEDPIADAVAQRQADEQAANNYTSHWNMAGQGPDVRFGLAAGLGAVTENIYSAKIQRTSGEAITLNDLTSAILDAERTFNQYPDQRAVILDPNQTHLGIGVAYNKETQTLKIVQTFVRRPLRLNQVLTAAKLGDPVDVSGVLSKADADAKVQVVVNLAYEPVPHPLTPEQLNSLGGYVSQAVTFDAREVVVNGDHWSTSSVNPSYPLVFNYANQPGLYHVRIWLRRATDVLVADYVVNVTYAGPQTADVASTPTPRVETTPTARPSQDLTPNPTPAR